MAEMVGLAYYINSEYLDIAADGQINGLSKQEVYDELGKVIAEKFKAKENIVKSRAIVLNTWYENDQRCIHYAAEVCRGIFRQNRLAVHWALLLCEYPIFFDMTSFMGNLLEYKDEFLQQQLRDRIVEKWGDRNTVKSAIGRNLHSLRDMGVLEPGSVYNSYKAIPHVVDDVKTVCLLAIAVLKSSGRKYMTWEQIVHHPVLFPFEISGVTQADLPTCDMLVLERMGGDVVIRIKD